MDGALEAEYVDNHPSLVRDGNEAARLDNAAPSSSARAWSTASSATAMLTTNAANIPIDTPDSAATPSLRRPSLADYLQRIGASLVARAEQQSRR